MSDVRFGWLSPVIGNRWSDHQPIVIYQQDHILPTALPHFDSLWIADHFYGFDARTDPSRICIGAAGERVGLPLVGRLADMWNGPMRRGDEAGWSRKRDIVRAAAEEAGRDPDEIEVTLTVERPLPDADAESESLFEDLARLQGLGVEHFVMDFGHPQSTEPVMRFVEQVITPLRSAAGSPAGRRQLSR